ncbi:MAG: hypothetical protein VZQ97_01920 [Candidatus Onthomonas sp.]|nr:hypothetical protein [Candidatus Onthomonas sp.]
MPSFASFHCIVSPADLPQLRSYPLIPVLYAYQVGAGPKLLRSCGPTTLRGGLLGASLGDASPAGDPSQFCRQAVLECQSRGAAGIFADWDRFSRSLFQFTRTLGHSLERAGLILTVPEAYAGVTEKARVLISSALSGGTLEVRLSEALERHGPDRTVLALQRMREDFRLPSPSGRGKLLSREELSALCARRPAVYWSSELCARYFTYRAGDGVHFVLFDDGASLQKKLELAHRLGIRHVCAAWSEISDCVGALTGQRG